jgi:Na+/H+ antiporter NhaD/arsenite permease-like protein
MALKSYKKNIVWPKVLAAAEVDIGNSFLPSDSLREGTFGTLISLVLPSVFWIAAVLVVLYFLWSGLQYLISKGDPKQLDAARKRMTYAILGLVIILTAALIVEFLPEELLGFKISIFGR